MKFGVGIPTCRQGFDVPPLFCGPQDMVEVSQLAEKLGIDFVWGSDFITPIPAMREKFGANNLNWYEIVVSMAYIAAATKKIGLGFGVIVLPFRDPVMLAKEISTLDVFSNGRAIFGVGLGAIRPEFEMLFASKTKVNRGKMLDEGIQVMRLLFDETEATFQGDYYSISNVAFHPKPIQPHFPIYVSGGASATAARIAKYGDGWVLGHSTIEQVKQKSDEVKGLAEGENRDPSKIDIICDGGLSIARTHEEAVNRYKNSFVGARVMASGKALEEVLPAHYVGTSQEIAEMIMERQKVGATHIVAQHIAGDNFGELKEQVQMFAEEVIPLCK